MLGEMNKTEIKMCVYITTNCDAGDSENHYIQLSKILVTGRYITIHLHADFVMLNALRGQHSCKINENAGVKY